MRRALLAAAASVALLAFAAQAAADPVPFSEAPLAGQAAFSGSRVRALLVHGDTLYVGGSFRVTQNGVTRSNLAAFDLSGNLKTSFNASPNGAVWALATDGVSLFVGGDFTRLGMKKRLAAVDLVTGAVVRPFTAHVEGAVDPEANTGVRALTVVTDNSTTPPSKRLVVGGNFTQLDSPVDNRAGLGALFTDSGDLDPERFTQGVAGGVVDALLATESAVYVGGAFTDTQGRTASLVALSTRGVLRNGYSTAGQPVIDLDYDPGTSRLFAAVGGTSNRVMAYGSSTRSSALWQGPRTGGDVQSVHFYGGNVYFGFHDGLFEQPDQYKLTVVDADTGRLEADGEHAGLVCDGSEELRPNCWLPEMDKTDGGQGFFGCWAITHFLDSQTGKPSLVVGGDFTQIGNVSNSRRLAIFSEPPPPPPPEEGEPGETAEPSSTAP